MRHDQPGYAGADNDDLGQSLRFWKRYDGPVTSFWSLRTIERYLEQEYHLL